MWENCPKATSKLVEWFKGQVVRPTGRPEIDIPMQQAFKDAEKAIQIALGVKTTFLYDFFDKEAIFLSVGRYKDVWVYTFEKVHQEWEGSGETREEIESEGFMEAFNIFERRLNA